MLPSSIFSLINLKKVKGTHIIFLFVIDEDQGLAKIHLQSLIDRRFKEKGPAYDSETRED